MIRLPKLKISWRRGKQYTSPVSLAPPPPSVTGEVYFMFQYYYRLCTAEFFFIMLIYVFRPAKSESRVRFCRSAQESPNNPKKIGYNNNSLQECG